MGITVVAVAVQIIKTIIYYHPLLHTTFFLTMSGCTFKIPDMAPEVGELGLTARQEADQCGPV